MFSKIIDLITALAQLFTVLVQHGWFSYLGFS